MTDGVTVDKTLKNASSRLNPAQLPPDDEGAEAGGRVATDGAKGAGGGRGVGTVGVVGMAGGRGGVGCAGGWWGGDGMDMDRENDPPPLQPPKNKTSSS